MDQRNQRRIDMKTITLGVKCLPHHRPTWSVLVTDVGAPERGGTTSGPQVMNLSCCEGRRRVVVDASPPSVVDHHCYAGRSNTWLSSTRVIGMRREVEDSHLLMVCTLAKGGCAGATNSRQIIADRARCRAPLRSHSTAVHPPIGRLMSRRGGSWWRRFFPPQALPPHSPAAGGHSHLVWHCR
jgi:hypothetical protein